LPELAAAPFHGAIVLQMDKVFYGKIGVTEIAFQADFDLLNCVGSPKVRQEMIVMARPIDYRFAGSRRRAGGGAGSVM